MGANNAEVSSVALTGLQTDLTSLSNTLHEIYDLMNADMNQVKEFWQDPKYEEFRNGYSKQIKHCEDVSVRYSEWCNKILTPAIDKVVEIERADVGGDGGGISSMGAGAGAGATAGAAAAAGASAKPSKISGFNTSGKPVTSQQSSSEVASKIDAFLSKPQQPKPLTEADKECMGKFGNDYRGRPVRPGETPSVTWRKKDISSDTREVTTGLGGEFIIKGELGSKAVSGWESEKQSEGQAYCEPVNGN